MSTTTQAATQAALAALPATNLSELVDKIGFIKAQMAPFMAQLKALEDTLKANGPGTYRGDFYQAKVFEQERSHLDLAAVREKLSPQFLRAHTTESTVTVLKVTARQLSDQRMEA